MKPLFIILLGLSFGLHIKASDDPVYYAKISNTRTYMNIPRVTTSEYWFTKDKYCSTTNQIKSIIRKDLGVRYTIFLNNSTFRMDSIKSTPIKSAVETGEVVSKDEPDFKYLGLTYSPIYEWSIPRQLPADTLGNYICDHFICEGDADFDQVSIEFSVAKTDDLSLAFMITTLALNIMRYENTRKPLIEMLTKNKFIFPMNIIEIVDNPIAPPITTQIKVDILEKLKADNGLFEVPNGYTKTK